MKAVILAAGQGRRLRSITYAIPKPLFPLAGGTLLDYLLARLTQAGMEDVTLVVREAARWREHVPDAITWVEQGPPWTLAQALLTARKVAPPDAPLLILHGDNLVDADLAPLPEAMKQAPAGVALIGEEDRAYGTTGVYWLPARALDILARHPELDDLSDLWPLLEEAGIRLMALTLEGRRFNINTLRDYLEAHRYVLTRWSSFAPLAVWPGALDPGTRTWVAENAMVEESTLEEVTVGPGAAVVRSRLKGCIIAPGTSVYGAQAEDRVFFSV